MAMCCWTGENYSQTFSILHELRIFRWWLYTCNVLNFQFRTLHRIVCCKNVPLNFFFLDMPQSTYFTVFHLYHFSSFIPPPSPALLVYSIIFAVDSFFPSWQQSSNYFFLSIYTEYIKTDKMTKHVAITLSDSRHKIVFLHKMCCVTCQSFRLNTHVILWLIVWMFFFLSPLTVTGWIMYRMY